MEGRVEIRGATLLRRPAYGPEDLCQARGLKYEP